MTKLVIRKVQEDVPVQSSAPKRRNTANKNSWLLAMPPHLRDITLRSLGPLLSDLEEIRLRLGRPIIFRIGQRELTADQEGRLSLKLREGYCITGEDLERTFQVLSQSSLYAWEEELRQGFITIPGGHRVGITGKGVLDKGLIRTLKDLSGVNYRIGREIIGCGDHILPYLLKDDRVLHTLIVSAPQCGKTTLLRDLIRQISDGRPDLGWEGVNVGLVDERSEIAGMYQGEPQFDLGLRTDILDACPKAEGIMLLIRSMSPRVIATDEIGSKEDVTAINHALQAGVTVLTTVHGTSYEEILERPVLNELLSWRFFERVIFLSRKRGPGTLETMLDGKKLERVR